jgi:hypothetical protein
MYRQVRGLLTKLFVAELFMAFGEQRRQRPQLRMLFRQGAGDLLSAQLGQPCLALRDPRSACSAAIKPNAAASAARVAPPIAMSPSPGSARNRKISSARPPEARRGRHGFQREAELRR